MKVIVYLKKFQLTYCIIKYNTEHFGGNKNIVHIYIPSVLSFSNNTLILIYSIGFINDVNQIWKISNVHCITGTLC